MKTVKTNGLELVYRVTKQGVQFSIDSKIKVVKAYTDGVEYGSKARFVEELYNSVPEYKHTKIKTLFNAVNNWAKLYKEGKLKINNTFSINHQKTKTITIGQKIEDKEAQIKKLQEELNILKKAQELLVA